MYTIELADGTKLTDLDINGSNYVSKKKVDESIFTEEALAKVAISDGEKEETFENLIFIQQMKWSDGTYYLAFREQTAEEKAAQSVTDIQLALAELYEMLAQ